MGREINSDGPKTWEFGITKTYFKEFDMTMTTNVALNLYTMNYSTPDMSESYDEKLISENSNSAHYTFSIIHENIFYPWFDVEMKLIK